MANPYCDIDKLGWFIDTRSVGMLGNDQGASTNTDPTKLQGLLDTAASELESHLSGRVPLPISSPPLVLTRVTAGKTAEMLYLRRGNAPKGIKELIDWATGWLKDFDEGRVSIDGVERIDSDRLQEDDATATEQLNNLTDSL